MLPDAVRALIERLAGRIVAEEDAALEGKGVEEWVEDLEPELLVDFFRDYQTFIREARAIIKLQNREVGDAVA
jgi:hypothetical protein